LAKVPIGHVDTWTVWVNGTIKPVIDALDWVGVDAYPYFQSTMANPIDAAPDLFWEAFENTQNAIGDKEIWITETGWPVAGKDMNLAKAGVEPAQQYWNEIGCALFNNYKTWWYMLRDADPTPPTTEFGVIGADLKPYYDLSCKNAKPVPRPTGGSSPSGTESAGPSRTSGTTFTIETSGTSDPPSTTDSAKPSSAFALKATMGMVAIQAVVAAFFVL